MSVTKKATKDVLDYYKAETIALQAYMKIKNNLEPKYVAAVGKAWADNMDAHHDMLSQIQMMSDEFTGYAYPPVDLRNLPAPAPKVTANHVKIAIGVVAGAYLIHREGLDVLAVDVVKSKIKRIQSNNAYNRKVQQQNQH